MKKSILSIVLICTSFLVFAQETTSPTNVPCYKKKKICNYKLVSNCNDLVAFDDRTNTYLAKSDYHTPYTGKCSACYRNGVLQEQINVINGKRDSPSDTSYYESGCMQSRQTFIMGKLNGTSVFYYDSTGRKEIEVTHSLDKLDGKYILFENNPKNDTLRLISYKNNLYDGPQKEYFDNSVLAKVVYYKNGLLHGKHQTYTIDGKLEIEMNYFEGKKNGTWKFYYPNGMEAHIENWALNVKNGEFKTLNEKGEIVSQEFYKKGIPEGKHIFNYPNGKPKHITVYEKGEIVEETEFEELTGAKHVIKERVDKKAVKNKTTTTTSIDDDPDEIKTEPTKKSKKKKKKN